VRNDLRQDIDMKGRGRAKPRERKSVDSTKKKERSEVPKWVVYPI